MSALLTAAVALLAGCNDVGGAGTFTVCGQGLFTAANMPVDHDVSSGPALVHDSGFILLRVAPDCTHGVDVTVTPAAAVQVVSRAKADDGRTAGVVLRLDRPQVQLTITRPDGSSYDVVVVNDELTRALSWSSS